MQALPWISAAFSVVSTIGEFTSARSASKANAAAARQEQEQARIQRDLEIQQSRRRSAQIMSKQQATAAAAGIAGTSGTPLETLLDSAYQAELEAETIRYGGDVKISEGKWRERLARLQGQNAYGKLVGGLGTTVGDLWMRTRTK